jgi:Flp pilus assembly protein TadD
MSNQADVAEAERLKTLGNELYQQGEYDAARHRYTEAIKKNPKNPVLYANRGAVYLATKECVCAENARGYD